VYLINFSCTRSEMFEWKLWTDGVEGFW